MPYGQKSFDDFAIIKSCENEFYIKKATLQAAVRKRRTCNFDLKKKGHLSRQPSETEDLKAN